MCASTLGCNNDQTLFVPTPFGISPDQSKGMLSDNPRAGIYEAKTSRTLDSTGGNPSCNQGGMLIVEKPQDLAYCMTVGNFGVTAEEETPTLMARDFKDPPVIGHAEGTAINDYIVRRLTPFECARLQGYPDGWCENLSNNAPTDEEIAIWQQMFAEHKRALGKTTKPKTERQIRKWLANPQSDSSEYKAYGNSVAVPCVRFILAGIVWAASCDE